MFTVPFTYWASSDTPLQEMIISTTTIFSVGFGGKILKINENGVPDTTFNAGGTGFAGNIPVVNVAKQSSGKLICLLSYAIGGPASYNSNGTSYTLNNRSFFRLNEDGTFDTTFTLPNFGYLYYGRGSNLAGGNNSALVILDDDSIIVMNDDDRRILKFPPNGASSPINNISLNLDPININKTPDNKITVGGPFSTAGGVTVNRFTRLNSDLTIDSSFVYGGGLNGISLVQAVQSDNKIIVGGSFSTMNGVSRSNIGRFNSDGAATDPVDFSFRGLLTANTFFSTSTYAGRLKADSDDKVVMVRNNTGTINYSNMNGIIPIYSFRFFKVEADGNYDTTFAFTSPSTGLFANSNILSWVKLNSGKYIIVGSFTSLTVDPQGSIAKNRIARINEDGTIDTDFLFGGATAGMIVNITLL